MVYYIHSCEYSSTRDKAPFGRSLRLRNVIVELVHYEFERLRLDSNENHMSQLAFVHHAPTVAIFIISLTYSFSFFISIIEETHFGRHLSWRLDLK